MTSKKNFLAITIIIQITITTQQQDQQQIKDHLQPPPINNFNFPKFQYSLPVSYPSNLPQENGPPFQPPIRSHQTLEAPGLMQRVARWFGFGSNNENQLASSTSQNFVPSANQQHFGNRPNEQYVQASYTQPQYKELPYQQQKPKAQCNPCNKVPWIPMFPGNIQYPILQGNYPQSQPQVKFNHHPQQYELEQPPLRSLPFQQSNHVQRAVNYLAPRPNNQNFNYVSIHQPIPVPNLSATPIPPLYNAAPFQSENQVVHQSGNYYVENLGQPSEIRTQLPPSEFQSNQFQTGVEVLQSVPLTDFVSSVEYPVKYSEGHLIDLSQNVESNDLQNNVNSNDYPKVIELGGNEHNVDHPSTVIYNHDATGDNFPEASSYNITFRNENHLNGGYSPTTQLPLIQETFLPTQISYTSIPPQIHFTQYNPSTLEISTARQSERNFSSPFVHLNKNFHPIEQQSTTSDYSTFLSSPAPFQYLSTVKPPILSSTTISPDGEKHFTFARNTLTHITPSQLQLTAIKQNTESTIVEIKPSLQTSSHFPDIYSKKHRDTPKHLLDAPIIYNHDKKLSSPSPFFRDPSDLKIRSTSYRNVVEFQPSTIATPIANSPTPTSTYSSLDASGQYAGMSPPPRFLLNSQSNFNKEVDKRSKNIHQIIIPYTTKNKPRPFKPREELENTDHRFSSWSHSNEEFHDQQESKVITSKHSTEQTVPKTTKYLTKILASNIRELLRKEHEVKNKSITFDLTRLQKNIDDWTEQEFSSASGKSSTIPISGRSKHIPKEYLTTTPSLRQSKTTKFFNIENLNRKETAILNHKNNLITHLWDKNAVNIESQELSNSIDVATIRLTSTTSSTTEQQPFYIRNVRPTKQTEKEIWQKAKVSISPLTKEKVYVVTPQPARFQTRTTPDSVGTFKSPRFVVRPTPANGGTNNSTNIVSSSTKSPYTPELFGLMGISAFIPSAPVDVVDGHSRVITVVTPTPHNSNRKRSTDIKERYNQIQPVNSKDHIVLSLYKDKNS